MTFPYQNAGLLRIGVFYDGSYFTHISRYYQHVHERRARLSITGLHEFIRDLVAQHEEIDRRFCQIVDAHYFRGRLSAKAAMAADVLYRDRQFDDVLIREGVTMHFLPLSSDREGDVTEKGIDVWFALEAYELAVHKRFDIIVLVTGDGDFVPLVRKLNTLGTRVMLLCWDYEYERDGKTLTTRTSRALVNEVTYPVLMSEEVERRTRARDTAVEQLFVQRREAPPEAAGAVGNAEPGAAPEAGDAPAEGSLQPGQVAKLMQDKRYGFIRPADGSTDLFFHASALENRDFADLKPGAEVLFRVVETDRGANAVSVRVCD